MTRGPSIVSNNNINNNFEDLTLLRFNLARRYLFVFASNFISAFVSIIIIMCEKRFSTDRERLALARKMDINNLTDEIQ